MRVDKSNSIISYDMKIEDAIQVSFKMQTFYF